jgi:hypothetical protein
MSKPHTTLLRAFQIEAIFNILSFPFLTHPRFILSHILLSPSQINPALILFTRLFGGLIAGVLGPLLLFSAHSSPEGRKTAYWSLGLGEGLLIPLLIGEALKGGDASKGAALSVKVALGSVGCLAPPLAWRIYTLFARPEMFGRSTKTE